MGVISFFIIIADLCIILFCVFICIRTKVAERNHKKIARAIYEYKKALLHGNLSRKKPDIDWSEMEFFDQTVKRFWDFGCTRILPKEKYELVKPFIRK